MNLDKFLDFVKHKNTIEEQDTSDLDTAEIEISNVDYVHLDTLQELFSQKSIHTKF